MIHNSQQIPTATFGDKQDLEALVTHIYSDDEISKFRMDDAIKDHPLSHKPTNIRSKLAYKEVLTQLKPSKKYALPGQFIVFGYHEPKYKEELEYYDGTPAVLFFGLTRTKEGNIREIGFNIHYLPPFARMKVLNTVYEVFKSYYSKYFNESPDKPNRYINYNLLKRMFRRVGLAFCLRMYIPVLRGQTYVIPTRLIPTIAFTEGHFSGATLAQIKHYWRQAKRK